MAPEIDEFRRLIRTFLEGQTELQQFMRQMNERRRAETAYLGAADGPIIEIIGLLNVYRPDDDPSGALVRDAIANQSAALAALGDIPVLRADTADQVIAYLKTDDADVRTWAAGQARAFAGDADVITTLRGRLQDPDPRVSRIAADSLARLDDFESIEPIAALLRGDLQRPFRHEIWALQHLAEVAGGEHVARVVDVLERYLGEGGAAVSQAGTSLGALRSRSI